MSCGTRPIFSLTGSVSLLTFLPSMRTSPESGWSNPAIMETMVVFPAPFGSEQADRLSVIGAKTDVADGHQLSVALRQAFHFQHD